MPFPSLFNGSPKRNISHFSGIFPGLSENDIIFFKTDVCVHPLSTSFHCSDHNPGVLIIQKQNNKKSLLIAWIQHEIFKKYTQSSPQKPDTEQIYGFVSSQNCDMIFINTDMMRSAKIIYDNETHSRGQFVIMSSEGIYRTFHFHNGGLQNLAFAFESKMAYENTILENLKMLVSQKKTKKELYFSTVHSYLPYSSFHPNEGRFKSVGRKGWNDSLDDNGRVVYNLALEKAIFFCGVDDNMRSEVWPFLLGYYGYNTTREERQKIMILKRNFYKDMKTKRLSMSEHDYDLILGNHGWVISKDVVRTDRTHPFYAGNDNPNIKTLTDILEIYALNHPRTGYIQGMSDILAPILAIMKNEADAYWCFEGAMKHTIFYLTSKSVNLDEQLLQILELVKLLLPDISEHVKKISEGGNMWMNFCHRWLLVSFKRDFHHPDFLKIWEACWIRREISNFQLFVCLAILSLYGGDAFQLDMDDADLLMHFNCLSMNMNLNAVLKRARCLLHKFKMSDVIPCTLYKLFGNDKRYVVVECSGHQSNKGCPLL